MSTLSAATTGAVPPMVPDGRQLGGTGQEAPRWTQRAWSSITLQYLESSPVLVVGPVTGRRYEFSAARPIQSIDGRDAATLLRTPFFRRI